MTYACTCFDDRYLGGIANEIDQATRSTRDDEINFTYCIEQLGSSGVIVWQQNAETFGKTRLTQYLMDDGHFTIVGISRLLATFQDYGTSCLETKTEYVDGHIWTGFVDYANHAERHRNLADDHTIGTNSLTQLNIQRRRKRRDIAGVGCNTGNTTGIEQQTVVAVISRVHSRQVFGIGSDDGIGVSLQGIGELVEHIVDLLLVEFEERKTCTTGLFNKMFDHF